MRKEHTRNECGANRHPWEGLEEDFRIVIRPRTDPDAFNRASDTLAKAIIAAVRRFVGWRVGRNAGHIAEEVSQQWWAADFDRICKRYDPTRPFHRYAYRWLRRSCQTYLRSERRKRLPGLNRDVPDERHNRRVGRWHDEILFRVDEALQQLSEEQRQAFLLRYLHGLAASEAAAVAGCSVVAIYMRVYHAREKLDVLLEDLKECFRQRGKNSGSSGQ